jgi:hypothetical protein
MFRFSLDIKDALKRSEKELLKAGIIPDSDFTQALWKNLEQKYPKYDFHPGAEINDRVIRLEFLTLLNEYHFQSDATPKSYKEASNIVSETFFFVPERVWLEDSLNPTPDRNVSEDNDSFDEEEDFAPINNPKFLSSPVITKVRSIESPKTRETRPGYCKCGSGKKYKKCCGK